jgi:hypothetical protein
LNNKQQALGFAQVLCFTGSRRTDVLSTQSIDEVQSLRIAVLAQLEWSLE